MSEWLIGHQGAVRAAMFIGSLALLAALERALPRRRADFHRRLRWPANLGLVALDTVLLRLLPFAAMAAALWAQARDWSLLNRLDWPGWIAVPLAWIALDAAIYWQHRALHEIRALWPLHRPHHSDIEFDATTGVRFHPGEILLSMLYKCGVVLALGAPPLAVLLFEIALSSFSLFTHANLRLPPRAERLLRRLIVTPDMHRIHHSIHRVEHDSNYSNTLSVWDHVFRSYTQAPREGHETMRIGLTDFREPREQGLLRLLRQPLA